MENNIARMAMEVSWDSVIVRLVMRSLLKILKDVFSMCIWQVIFNDDSSNT